MGHGRLCPLQLAGIIRPPDVAAQKRPPAVEDEIVGRLWSACSESTSPVLGELRRKISNVAQDLCGEACCVEERCCISEARRSSVFIRVFPHTVRPDASIPSLTHAGGV